jgi:hypothetical protein
MRHFKKNIQGAWETCSLTDEEIKAIQEKTIKIGLGRLHHIRKMAEEHKILLTDACTAAILDKVAPSYDSLANDHIEDQLKKKTETPIAQ